MAISSSGSSSSELPPALANAVLGGICLLSPTMMTAFALPIAGIAAATLIWDASSNTTVSKN